MSQNPINAAIDAMHAAFVGGPAAQAGEPVDFGAPATLTPATLARFTEYWLDRDNWGGTPLVGGNVGGDPADKGYITAMKRHELVTTDRDDDGTVWITFTAAGQRLGAEIDAAQAPAPAEERPINTPARLSPRKPATLQDAVIEAVASTVGLPADVAGRLTAHGIPAAHHEQLLADAVACKVIGWLDDCGAWALTRFGLEVAVRNEWCSEERATHEPLFLRDVEPAPAKVVLLPAPSVDPDPVVEEQVTPAHADVITEARAEKLLATTTLAIRSFIAHHPSPEDLAVLHRVESAGKARKTVLAALEARGVGLPDEEPIGFDVEGVAVVVEGPDTGKLVQLHKRLEAGPVELTVALPVDPDPDPDATLDDDCSGAIAEEAEVVDAPSFISSRIDSINLADLLALARELESNIGQLVVENAALSARIAALESRQEQPKAPRPAASAPAARKPADVVSGTLGAVSPGSFAVLPSGAFRLVVRVGKRVTTVRQRADGSFDRGSDAVDTKANVTTDVPEEVRAGMTDFAAGMGA